MPSAPNALELSLENAIDAKYIEEKRQIIAELPEGSKAFEFFPKAILPKLNLNEIKAMIRGNGYVIEEGKKAVELRAKNYSRLVEILAELQRNGINTAAIEPERQFLILNSLDYRRIIVKSFYKEIAIDKTLTIKPKEIISSLLEVSEKEAYEFAKKIALAKILHLKLADVSKKNRAELNAVFAENIFFKAGAYLYPIKQENLESNAELTFEKALQLFKIMQEYNIAPDSINCNCKRCKERILASSIVEVKAKSDGVFIDNPLQGIDELFHYNYGRKKQRIARQRNFYLHRIPIGPLSRKETKNICLADVNDYVEIVRIVVPQHSCYKKSRMIMELEKFLKAIKELEAIRDGHQKLLAREKKLIAWNMDAKILYLNAAIESMKELFSGFISLAYNYFLGFEFGLALRATKKAAKNKRILKLLNC
ncbi:MAG: hypothetical protein J7L14_03010 [Candidatus Diapherotrites archaeon]|nr:hypothetical protein [Candidatus Diapherotrites archaeon]